VEPGERLEPVRLQPVLRCVRDPASLPASKMASAGPDFRSNARTQILWGMRYIRGSYVTPYRAWLHEMHYGWY
jgi:hypothetical protein